MVCQNTLLVFQQLNSSLRPKFSYDCILDFFTVRAADFPLSDGPLVSIFISISVNHDLTEQYKTDFRPLPTTLWNKVDDDLCPF